MASSHSSLSRPWPVSSPCWPPAKKLKLGIDLSGGTILVYEVAKGNLPSNFNMDELIASLKQRIDPQGVREIPIRKIGSNRFEIILPKASAEEVEEVKRKLTDVGSLEFRILANRKHDAGVIDRALGPSGRSKPPARYQWAKLGEISTGTNPDVHRHHHHRPPAELEEERLRGDQRRPDRQDRLGRPSRRSRCRSSRNTATTLTLAKPHDLQVDHLVSDRVQPQQHPRRRPAEPPPGRPDHPRGAARPGLYRALHPLPDRPTRT